MKAQHVVATAACFISICLPCFAEVRQVSTAADFNKAVSESRYCVAKVYTSSCPLCKGHQIDDLAAQWERNMDTEVTFIKANYHSMPGLFSTAPYRIRTVPRYLFFKDGHMVSQLGSSTVASLQNTLIGIID